MSSSHDRNWRRVPKVNILSSQRTTAPTTWPLRVLLLVTLLVEAFLIQDWYRERLDVLQKVEGTTARFRVVERQLGEQQRSVDALRTELSQLQRQRQTLEEELQDVTGDYIDWNGVLTALFGAEVSGTRFLSVIGEPEGDVVLEGMATAPEAIKTLPTQLTAIPDVLELQSIRWVPGSDPPTFTAVFKVLR